MRLQTEDIDKMPAAELRAFVHELGVRFQMELETQNQELRSTRQALEEAHEACASFEDRYREVYEFSPVAYLSVDASGAVQAANLTASALLGVPRNKLTEMNLSSFIAPGDQNLWCTVRRSIVEGKPTESFELVLKRPDEQSLQVRAIASTHPRRTGRGRSSPPRVRLAFIDITERKHAERASRAGERRLRLVADIIPLLFSYVDRQERYRFNNAAYEEWFGLPAEKSLGRHVREILGERAYAMVRGRMREALAGHLVRFSMEIPFRRAGRRFVSVIYAPDRDEAGNVHGFYSLTEDQSRGRHLERALRVTVMRESLTDQRERRATAMELDNQFGQMLSLVSLKLAELEDAADATRTAQIREIGQIINETRDRLAHLSDDLSPSLLFDVGIVAAAEWLAEELRRQQRLDVQVQAEGEIDTLDDSGRIVLFRALHDLLLRVDRNDSRRVARVRIGRRGARARIEISGVRFRGHIEDEIAMLSGTRVRAEQLGGTLEIDPNLPEGVRIRIELPLRFAPSTGAN